MRPPAATSGSSNVVDYSPTVALDRPLSAHGQKLDFSRRPSRGPKLASNWGRQGSRPTSRCCQDIWRRPLCQSGQRASESPLAGAPILAGRRARFFGGEEVLEFARFKALNRANPGLGRSNSRGKGAADAPTCGLREMRRARAVAPQIEFAGLWPTLAAASKWKCKRELQRQRNRSGAKSRPMININKFAPPPPLP